MLDYSKKGRRIMLEGAWNFFKLFLLSYFILVPCAIGFSARWLVEHISFIGPGTVSDYTGWIFGIGTFLICVFGAYARVTSITRD